MTANQQNTTQDSQRALQQAFEAPMEQTLQVQKSAAQMFMNSMELGYWAQNQGLDLTRNLFQNYIDTVEDAVYSTEQIAEQGIEMGQATMQQSQQGFGPFQQPQGRQQGFQQRPQQPQGQSQRFQQQPQGQQYQQPQGQQYQGTQGFQQQPQGQQYQQPQSQQYQQPQGQQYGGTQGFQQQPRQGNYQQRQPTQGTGDYGFETNRDTTPATEGRPEEPATEADTLAGENQ